MALRERDEARLQRDVAEGRWHDTFVTQEKMRLEREEALWQRDVARLAGDMAQTVMNTVVAEKDAALREKIQADFERDITVSNTVDAQMAAKVDAGRER